MKKRKICVVSSVMILLTVLTLLSVQLYKKTAKADDGISFLLNTQSENLPEGFLDNQHEANEIMELFYEYLRDTYGVTCNDTVYTVSGIRAEYFPPYYAGCYINTDGHLILQVVNTYYTTEYLSSEWYQEFVEIVGSENFYCHPARYSYTELTNAISEVTIGSLAEEFADLGVSVVSAGVNDYQNVVEVNFQSIEDYDAASYLLDSDIYLTSVIDDVPQDQIGVYPGGEVFTNGPGYTTHFSVACRVRRNFPDGTYDIGVLTCAHAFSGTSDVYMDPGSGTNILIGKCYQSYQHNQGNADVAYIKTNTNATLYDTIYGSTTTLYHNYTTQMGTVVYKRGAGTTNITSGTVYNTNYSVTTNGITLTDLVLAYYSCDHGDSGGIIYATPDSTNHAYPVGIHKGGSASGGYGYFTKMYNGLAALQMGPITLTIY